MNLSIRKINVPSPLTLRTGTLACALKLLRIVESSKRGHLCYEGLDIATCKDVVVCSVKMTRNANLAAATSDSEDDTETADSAE